MNVDPFVDAVAEAAEKHPGTWMLRTQLAIGAFLGMFGVVVAFTSYPLVSVSLIAVCGFFVWSAYVSGRILYTGMFANAAYGALRNGEAERATRLLEAAEPRAPRAVRRILAGHRALLALDAGRPDEAVTHATRGIETKLGLMVRDIERSNVAWLHAVRGLAHAARSDDARALADADAAADERYATPVDIGHAELVRAVVAARQDRKAEVLAALGRGAPFFDELAGKERTLVADLARFARGTKRTIYRHAAQSTRDPIAAWSVLAPDSPDAPIADAPPSRDDETSRQRRRTLVLWVILILMFLAIWEVLNATPIPPPPGGDVMGWSRFSVLLLPPFAAGLLTRMIVAAQKARIARRRATTRTLRGDDAAREELARLARAGEPDAYLQLARLAERAASFTIALEDCDSGLACVKRSPAVRARAYDDTAPALASERAVCLAALGRNTEAEQALASMPNAVCYVYASTARFRVRFAQALVRGDREAALEVGRAERHLPMPMRDVFVIDLLEATEGDGADDDEWTRLRAELAASPSLRRWVDHFLPGLGTGAAKRRVAPPKVETDEVDFPDAAPAVEQS